MNTTSNTYIKFIFLFLGISIILSCKVTKPYQQPDMNANTLYRDQNSQDTATIATMPPEQIFTDTILRGLIKEGISQNLNLKIAIQKIAEAQAAFGQTKAAFLPNLSANASATRSKQSAAALELCSRR